MNILYKCCIIYMYIFIILRFQKKKPSLITYKFFLLGIAYWWLYFFWLLIYYNIYNILLKIKNKKTTYTK